MRPFVEFQSVNVHNRFTTTFATSIPRTQDDIDQEKLREPKKSCLLKSDRVQRSKSVDGRGLKVDLTDGILKFCTPSSPSQKKVHFADTEGLALVNVKNFVPSSDDLDALERATRTFKEVPKLVSNFTQNAGTHSLVPCFQSRRMAEILGRLQTQNICLECVQIQARTITSIVRVKNLDFEKIVSMRYTLDDWQTFEEIVGNYIPKSSDGLSDRFMIVVTVPRKNRSVELAFRFRVKGQEYWDSNDGSNYKIADVLSF